MLIASDRLSQTDLARWAILERTDRVNAQRRKAMVAGCSKPGARRISAFAAGAIARLVSWGRTLSSWHIWWPRWGFGDEDRQRVFCACTEGQPGLRCCSRCIPVALVAAVVPRSGGRPEEARRYDEQSGALRPMVPRGGLPERRITGVRAAESQVRALSAATHGVSTETSCRPILRWSTSDVFAYLALHDLPVHPAYAQSMGGLWDREHLRVAPLGGHEGSGHGRAEWEQALLRGEVATPPRSYLDAIRETLLEALECEDETPSDTPASPPLNKPEDRCSARHEGTASAPTRRRGPAPAPRRRLGETDPRARGAACGGRGSARVPTAGG